MIDGEAVILGVDGISDFDALHSGRHNEEVQLCAFDVLAMDGEDLRRLPLSMRKAKLARLLARRPGGDFHKAPSNRARSGRTCFARRAGLGWKVWFQSIATGLIKRASPSTGSRLRTGTITHSSV